MNISEDLKYTKEHEWLRIEGDYAFIGITDFAEKELGDIVFVEVDSEGEELEKDDVFGTIEAVKTVSDLFMPVKAEVKEFNSNLEDSPELINTHPYTDGWIIKIHISEINDINSLMSSEEYKNLIS